MGSSSFLRHLEVCGSISVVGSDFVCKTNFFNLLESGEFQVVGGEVELFNCCLHNKKGEFASCA